MSLKPIYEIVLRVDTVEEKDRLTEFIEAGQNSGHYHLLNGILVKRKIP
ncbi:MAG: hypothetical protein WA144_15380 [Candidatus Methanoperedens sp.]